MPVSTRLLSLGRELDTGPDAFGEPVRSDDAVGQPDVLRALLETDGYLFIPGFFDRDLIHAARGSLTDRLATAGLLDPESPAIEARAHSGKLPAVPADIAQNNPALEHFFLGLLGDGNNIQQIIFSRSNRHFQALLLNFGIAWFVSGKILINVGC